MFWGLGCGPLLGDFRSALCTDPGEGVTPPSRSLIAFCLSAHHTLLVSLPSLWQLFSRLTLFSKPLGAGARPAFVPCSFLDVPFRVSSFIITASVIYIPTHISSLDLRELQTCTATGSVHAQLEVTGVSRLHISEITLTVLLSLCPTPPLPLSTWSSSWALCLRAWESLPTQAQPEASSLTWLPVLLLCRICLATLVRGTIIAHKRHKTTLTGLSMLCPFQLQTLSRLLCCSQVGTQSSLCPCSLSSSTTARLSEPISVPLVHHILSHCMAFAHAVPSA